MSQRCCIFAVDVLDAEEYETAYESQVRLRLVIPSHRGCQMCYGLGVLLEDQMLKLARVHKRRGSGMAIKE